MQGRLEANAVASFVREYWPWAFDQFPMTFGLLDRTRKALHGAQSLDDRPAVGAVVQAVTFRLDIKLPGDMRRRLDENGAA